MNQASFGSGHAGHYSGACKKANSGYNRAREAFMITIKARFDGRVFVPEAPVDLPVGCELEIVIPAPASQQQADLPLVALADLMDRFPENPLWPADGAAQYDHYLYG